MYLLPTPIVHFYTPLFFFSFIIPFQNKRIKGQMRKSTHLRLGQRLMAMMKSTFTFSPIPISNNLFSSFSLLPTRTVLKQIQSTNRKSFGNIL